MRTPVIPYAQGAISSATGAKAGLAIRVAAALAGVAILPGAGVLLPAPATAAASVNLRDADIRAFIEDVARTTGASFVIDQRVQGKVSVASDRPLSPEAYFELFLATLRANGYAATPIGGGQYRIGPAEPGAGGVASGPMGRSQFSTAVIPLAHVAAPEAVEALRPVLSRNGAVAASRSGNAVVLTDFTDNLAAARRVLQQIDRDRTASEIVSLRNAGAHDLAESLKALLAQESEGDDRPSVTAVGASNALVIRGHSNRVARLAALARELDTKAGANGAETRVVFLQHADAGAIVPVLQRLMGEQPDENAGNSQPASLAGTPFGGRRGADADAAAPEALGVASGPSGRRAIITRYDGANAIVIAAPPALQRQLADVIRQLDIQRQQVQVEAIIVEISDTAAKQLGVQFALAGNGGKVPFVSTNFSNASPDFMAITGAIAGERGLIPDGSAFREQAIASLLGTTGGTGGFGQIGSDTIFGFIINAVKADADSNILSTPSVLTLDNQPAHILVGQEIPVTTGEALGDNLDNSFRTVNRQDVGIQLSVRPQINAGGSVTLTLKQVVSSIAEAVADRDFVLNKRELQTAVTVADGQVLALGGLLNDQERRSLQRVPLLGDIPGIGALFRSQKRSREKTNLMIFIRPTIIRTASDAARLTANRWDNVRQAQINHSGASALDALAWSYLRQAPPDPPPLLPAEGAP